MGAGHDHGGGAARAVHDHGGAAARHRGRLWAAFALLAAFMAVEAVAAWLTGSLALLSDAGHMFTDVLGIGMALAAITAARKAGDRADPQRTFGLYRLEVLAALANAVLLFGVALYVLVEAARRLAQEAPEVRTTPMLVVASAGLVANVVAFLLLRGGAGESINVRGAYLEVLGDLVSSVGVIVAAAIIAGTGWWWVDAVVAVAVGLFILPRTYRLGRAAVRILVQAAPDHVDVAAVGRRLGTIDGVRDVHDLHVWTLTSGMDVASAHLGIEPEAEVATVLAAARTTLRTDFGIDHATLQCEPVAHAKECGPTNW
jgi:cobalt-zinc-cadmium efflux system protein